MKVRYPITMTTFITYTTFNERSPRHAHLHFAVHNPAWIDREGVFGGVDLGFAGFDVEDAAVHGTLDLAAFDDSAG
jgi:hypothetical protein